jgi:hypothetical protein
MDILLRHISIAIDNACDEIDEPGITEFFLMKQLDDKSFWKNYETQKVDYKKEICVND